MDDNRLPSWNDKPRFVRDGVTWLGYILLAAPSYTLGAFGPFMPFLRSELDLSYTIAALHVTAWAVGNLLCGAFGDRSVAALGRANAAWLGTAGLSLAIVVLVMAHHPVFTIAAAFVAGGMGTLISQCINAIMADRFGDERTLGYMEANVAASSFCLLAPIAVSGCVRFGAGWRAAMMLPIIIFVFLFAIFGKRKIPTGEASLQKADSNFGLPAAYWAYWTLIMFAVACEWSLIFWSAEFLHQSANLSKPDAAASVAVFLVAMLSGRIFGRIAARHLSTQLMLPLASFIAVTGFFIYWLGPTAAIKLGGLLITGLGISNFFPLSLSAAVSTSPAQASIATARISVSTGLAVIVAPLMLGFVADHTNIFTAYAVIAFLLLSCTAMAFVANRFARQHSAAAATLR
ncbi:MAG TPA: MFS transporter [Candidatus Obscuribacterales bacterium]